MLWLHYILLWVNGKKQFNKNTSVRSSSYVNFFSCSTIAHGSHTSSIPDHLFHFSGRVIFAAVWWPKPRNWWGWKKPSLSITSVFSLMTLPGQFTGCLCNRGEKWKGLGEKETISWGLLNLAWIPFCPNGWSDKAPAFPSWFCILRICLSKVKS